MEEIISKEEFKELLKIKGEARGFGFKAKADFVREERGQEAFKKLGDEMARLGYPYSDIKTMEFYPIGLLAAILLVIKRLFNFTDEDFQEMGKFEAQSSLVIRLLMKYFISLEKMSQEASKIWRKYYSIGVFEIIETDEEKKTATIRIKDFKLHPIMCQIFIGYFTSIMKLIVKSDQISCKETKSPHKNDECHEFLMNW